ncbi:integrase core domain protein [Aphelenchoides avenae]|nr:integrase core domain protein [Aphelenchus avenae]
MSRSAAQPPLQRSPHDDYSTAGARNFFSRAEPPFPAHNAGEEVLAPRSSKLAPTDWHSLMQPLARARVDGQQNDSRPPEGSKDTYEDRTLEIMQHIWQLSDNYDRMHVLASRMQPNSDASYQRLHQLYTSVRETIDELRNDCTQYTYLMGDWDILATEHLSEDSEWSRKMLQHRRAFFEDPAFIPKQLDEKQMDLLDYYGRIQQRIEDIIQDRDTAASATHSRDFPAHNAGNHRVSSATKKHCAALRLGTQPTPNDDEVRHRNILGEPLPQPIRMGWTTARGGARSSSLRPAAHNAAGVAPSSDLAAHNAARHLEGDELRKATKPMMSTYKSSAAAGRGPSISSSSGLQVGADGKPFSGSHAATAQPSSTQGAADFGPEHTNAFYQNAMYHRSAAPTPLVLKAPGITPFEGDLRAYPAFRNNFLQLIEGQQGWQPRHKMQYLLQCLRGEPLREASRYMISDLNYFKVLDRLEQRYGNRGNLLYYLHNQLDSLPAASDAADELRRFHDDSVQLLSELRQNGENVDSVLFSPRLLQKLPQSVRYEILRRCEQNLPPPLVMLELLHDYLRVLEAADFMGRTLGTLSQTGPQCRGDPRSHSQNRPNSSSRHHDRYNNFMAEAIEIAAKCAFCDGPHWASQCHVYDTIAKRQRRAKQLKYCYLCLKACTTERSAEPGGPSKRNLVPIQ